MNVVDLIIAKYPTAEKPKPCPCGCSVNGYECWAAIEEERQYQPPRPKKQRGKKRKAK